MNKYDILPTKSNLALSIKNDTTGRNSNLYNLLRLLNFQQDSLSIAINGSWGTGKTFFIKQCQLMLDNAFSCEDDEILQAIEKLCPGEESLANIRKTHFRTAYYDAWEHDSEEDPIASLIRCLATTDWSTNVKESLIKAADIGSSILQATTNIDLKGLVKTLKDNSSDLITPDNLEQIKKRFNATLAELAPDQGKLIIFVDELDRCKPTYAVKLLERIKHYFNNPNVTFIFAVDLSQLQYTINQYYGLQFNGYQYLDRFFDLVISLSAPDIDKYFDNTKNILEAVQHFEKSDPKNSYYYLFCKELINHFSFSIRQINHFYLKTNSAAYNLLDQILNPQGITFQSERNGKFIIYEFLLPLMNALNQADIDEYNNFISGNASKETLNILAKSKYFTKYYKDISINESNIDIIKGVSDIYNAIFNDQDQTSLRISNECTIDYPSKYKKKLIDACSLLSPEIKLD
ncbi:KAP family P-loop NTPase fold protein [Limosilactobacillus reuteri]|uniref:KAP family P-loop NTPase fold protein n=1 Tax=Limosilactobacillus reuteri TaxID=1598 RepID=UPI0023608C06|nr:P-loop NTPase fold protein [Limosilactobacillus reuteri]MDD1381336.1 P-loop NTPase fold protein [Limosilactobacillus reuteri]